MSSETEARPPSAPRSVMLIVFGIVDVFCNLCDHGLLKVLVEIGKIASAFILKIQEAAPSTMQVLYLWGVGLKDK